MNKYIKKYESFIGGVNFDNILEEEIRATYGEPSKFIPYILSIGGTPPLNVTEVSGGKIIIRDKNNKIISFPSLDIFIKKCGVKQKS